MAPSWGPRGGPEGLQRGSRGALVGSSRLGSKIAPRALPEAPGTDFHKFLAPNFVDLGPNLGEFGDQLGGFSTPAMIS